MTLGSDKMRGKLWSFVAQDPKSRVSGMLL
jgi:hypothetical protein